MTVFVYVPLHPLTFLFPFLVFVLAIKSRVLSHRKGCRGKRGVGVNKLSGQVGCRGKWGVGVNGVSG